jgi:hypothetical protein
MEELLRGRGRPDGEAEPQEASVEDEEEPGAGTDGEAERREAV